LAFGNLRGGGEGRDGVIGVYRKQFHVGFLFLFGAAIFWHLDSSLFLLRTSTGIRRFPKRSYPTRT
jgi:hypothetical protein